MWDLLSPVWWCLLWQLLFFSPLRSGGVLSSAYRTNLLVFFPLSALQPIFNIHSFKVVKKSIIRRYDIPASLISIQHWCFFWTFFAGIVRDIVGSDNIWQIDEVNVSFPNFLTSRCFHRANSVIYSVNMSIHNLHFLAETRQRTHSTWVKAVFSTCSPSLPEVATQQMRSFYFEAFSTIVIILKKDRYIDRQTDR